jgi:hypothetical protein
LALEEAFRLDEARYDEEPVGWSVEGLELVLLWPFERAGCRREP